MRKGASARLVRFGLVLSSTFYGLRTEASLPKMPFRVGAPQRGWLGEGDADPIHLPVAATRSRGELFFVDAAVADPGAFWLAAPSGATVVCIPTGVDSWRFMAQEAEQFRGLAAIHIISHGEPGAVILNGRRYAAADLESRSLLLRELGRALTKNGDILLYGCDTGEGPEGARFVAGLAGLTGADVAASSNPTGGIPGADWKMEIAHGEIGTAPIAPSAYEHVLANFSVGSISSLRTAIATAVANGEDDTITLSSNISAANAGDMVAGPDGKPTFVVINNSDGFTLGIVGGGFILDAGHFGRALYVEAGAVDISNLTITKGLLSGNGGGTNANTDPTAVGAGVYNAGTLRLMGVAIAANKASGGGGGGGSGAVTLVSGGGGGGGFNSIGGGTGGKSGGIGSNGIGGDGAIPTAQTGLESWRGIGGSTAGGAGGYSSHPLHGAPGGGGGTAAGIGGGGGGAGYEDVGGSGGRAAGGIFNAGTLTIFGSSSISNNLGAGGGGGGGGAYYYPTGAGGNGGRGVGGIWNIGTLHLTASVFSGMSGNVGGQGIGGGSRFIQGTTPVVTANNDILYNTGTLDLSFSENVVPTFVQAGAGTLNISQNDSATGITGLLHVSDTDSSQTETWAQNSAPTHGTLSFSAATAASGSTDITPGGTITYAPTSGFAGSDSFVVQVGDGTGTATRTINVNVTPTAPGTPDLAAGSDSGASSSDNITSAFSLNFSGTSATGDSTSTVRVFLDNLVNGVYDVGFDPSATVTANVSGTWTITGFNTAGFPNGTYNVYAGTTSATGSLTSTSGALSLTLDTTAPTTTIATANFSADTGVSGADFITATAGQNISGTLSANMVSGDIVQVSLDNGATWSTANTSVGANTWALNGQTLAASNTLKVRVTDAAGNSGTTFSQAYVLDTTAPLIAIAPPSASIAAGGPITFAVTYSDTFFNASTLTAGNISLNSTGGASATFAVTGAGTTRTVTLSSITGNGTLGISIASGTASDLAGNLAPASGASTTFIVDNTAPTVTILAAQFSADTGISGSDFITATAAQTITGTLSANMLSGDVVQVSLDNGSSWTTAATTVGGHAWTLAGQTLTASSTLKVRVVDSVGNSGPTFSQAYVLDTTAPTIAIGSPSASTAAGGPITFVVTYVDANFNASTLVAGNVSLNATGSATAAIAVTGSGTTRTVTLSAITGNGTLGITIAGGTASDTAGNLAPASSASGTFAVDNSGPTVTSISRLTPATVNTAAASVIFRVTFSEAVTGVDITDFTLSTIAGTATGAITSVSAASGTTIDVTISSVTGVGTLRLDLKAVGTGIADTLGNALTGGGFVTGDFFLVGFTNVFDAASLATGATRSVSNATSNRVAQRFITAATQPLTIATVAAALGAVTGSPVPLVTIHADNSGAVGPTVMATLTNPASLTANALNVWSAATPLAASTTYWIVFADTSVAGGYEIKSSAATSGGTGAWLTAPNYFYFYGVNAATGPQAGALQIAIGATSTPTITSALTANATYGSAFAYTITATNLPTSYSATGLPPGLSLNTSTGQITGTPTTTAGSPFSATIGATNASGTGIATLIIAVGKASATITLGNLNQVYDGTPKSVSISVTPNAAVSVSTSPGTPINAGSYSVVVSITDPNYFGASASATLVIAKASQSVNFTSIAAAQIGVPIALGAITSSGLGITFSVVSGNASLSGSTLTLLDANPVVVRVTQAGDGNYNAASAEVTINAVAKLSQTITFASIPAHRASDAPFALSATASSGLGIVYSIVSGPASISGSTLTLTGGIGSVTVQATQSGNAVYAGAAPVTASFTASLRGATATVYFGSTNSATGAAPEPTTPGRTPSREPRLGEGAAAELGRGSPSDSAVIAAGVTTLAAAVSADGVNGTLIGYLGTNQGFAIAFTLDANGSFNATGPVLGGAGSPATLTVSGTVSASAISGMIQPLGLTFGAAVEPAFGPTAAISGFYPGSLLNSASGAAYSVVGTQGQIFILAVAPTFLSAGAGLIAANNTFSFPISTSATITGAINPATATLSCAISVTGQPDMKFTGLAAATARTDRLINLSSRVRVASTGSGTLLAGFVIGGAQSKRVLLRGVGPGLAGFGITDALGNPRLVLYDNAGTIIAQNDDWSAADAATMSQVGAFPLAAGSQDAALVITLLPGAYAIQVLGVSGTGIALAEIYDASLNAQTDNQRLVNVSTRGSVDAGNSVLIGGFVITGNSPKKVLIRGIGPSLGIFGVQGVLADPKLTLFSGSASIAQNDDWGTPVAFSAGQSAASASEIVSAAQTTGAFTLPANSKDAAIVVTLAPGLYTAQVSSANGATGVALVEIYELP